MKILIAVESCEKNRHLHQSMVDTWLGALPNDVDFRFFIGGSSSEISPLEVWVPSLDTYEGLVTKTKGICKWANWVGYDYLFKCDTDTVAHPGRLLESGFQQFDYMGGFNEDILPPSLNCMFPQLVMKKIQFASGGAGYWLSQKAMIAVAKELTMISPAEDVYVAAQLYSDNIQPIFHEGYRWKPGVAIGGAVTFHTSSALQVKHEPNLMYEYYERILR